MMDIQDSAGAQITGNQCAVLGKPIRHSLSPTLHQAAYRALGLAGIRIALRHGRPHQLAQVRHGGVAVRHLLLRQRRLRAPQSARG